MALRKKSSAPVRFVICYDSRVLSTDGSQAPAPRTVFTGLEALVDELYARSGAAAYGWPREEFAAALQQVVGKYLPGASSRQVAEFAGKLRVEELALARACAAGSEKAWEQFLTRYRERLFDAARAIAIAPFYGEAAEIAGLANSLTEALRAARQLRPVPGQHPFRAPQDPGIDAGQSSSLSSGSGRA